MSSAALGFERIQGPSISPVIPSAARNPIASSLGFPSALVFSASGLAFPNSGFSASQRLRGVLLLFPISRDVRDSGGPPPARGIPPHPRSSEIGVSLRGGTPSPRFRPHSTPDDPTRPH